MLKSTIERLKKTTFTIPIPKSRDPRSGYWVTECTVVSVNDAHIALHFVCNDWCDARFSLPIPHHLDSLFECMFLSISEMIVKERIEFLCGAG